MPDLSEQLRPSLLRHRLPGFNLGDEWVYPDYHGRSVLNIPSSICRLLGAPEIGDAGPLVPELLAPLLAGPRELQHVILVLVDALALHRLQRWINDGTALTWQPWVEKGLLAPLTSLVPSTTSAVLTSLWTGRSPAAHGTLGYEMWMKEYGVVVNTITHAPISFKGDVGSLSRAGFDPETALPFPTLGAHLAQHQVSTHTFQHSSIARSGLSRMLLKDSQINPFATDAELWINLRETLEANQASRGYYYVYWSEVDHLSHHYGPDDERVAGAFASFSAACERHLLKRLSPQARQGTALILVADHGQIATFKDPHYELRNHPGLERRLHMQPSGENRLAYLFSRPGQVEALREYAERAWPGCFTLVDPSFAVSTGLFGEDEPHPRLFERMGELIMLSRGACYLWWAPEPNPLLGRHGGLHPDEMLVPFLAARLD